MRLFGYVLLLVHNVDNGVGRVAELCGVSAFEPCCVPCKFDNAHLHTKAYAEHGHLVLSCILDRSDHTFYSTISKTARNDDSIYILKEGLCIFLSNFF